VLIYSVDECFGCGGDVDETGHFLHARVDRCGDGYPRSRALQCAFCGRPISEEQVNEVVRDYFEAVHGEKPVLTLPKRMSAKRIRAMQQAQERELEKYPSIGVPLCYIQRYLGHVDVRSTLNYVGGINNAIRAWTKRRQQM
jgi:hypothetical protein